MFNLNCPNNSNYYSCNDQHQPNYNISMCSLASLILLQKLPPSPAESSTAGDPGDDDRQALKAKIICHPKFSGLLHSYLQCLKVGAPQEMEARLKAKRHEFEAMQTYFGAPKDLELDHFMVGCLDLPKVEACLPATWQEFESMQSSYGAPRDTQLDQFMVEDLDVSEVEECLVATFQEFEARQSSSKAPADPQLDQFMEAYCDVLRNYREEIERPVKEAMEFLKGIETQLNILITNDFFPYDERLEDTDLTEKADVDVSNVLAMNWSINDRDLKNHLLRKYGCYLPNLKRDVSKKRMVRMLPKEARLKLLNWWELHRKWPYPTESEKEELAKATGLDEKQINNWFINQRKRHWIPPEDLYFMVMEGALNHLD